MRYHFSDLFSVCPRPIDHLILIFSGHTASFTIEISKVQDFGNFELSSIIIYVQPYPTRYETAVGEVLCW